MPTDDDNTAFIQLDDDGPVMSRSAFMLHGSAIVQSVQSVQGDRPGWISDDWLTDIGADTTTTAAELETAGQWQRDGDGYRILADDLVDETLEFSTRLKRTKLECEQRGHHIETISDGDRYCSHCLALLDQPTNET